MRWCIPGSVLLRTAESGVEVEIVDATQYSYGCVNCAFTHISATPGYDHINKAAAGAVTLSARWLTEIVQF